MAILKRGDGKNPVQEWDVESSEEGRVESTVRPCSMAARGPICSTFDPLNRPDRSVWRDPGTKDLEPRRL